MKKIIVSLLSLLLAISACFAFVACDSDGGKSEDPIFVVNAAGSMDVTKINDKEESVTFFYVGVAVIREDKSEPLTLRASDFTVKVDGKTLTGEGFVGTEHIIGGTSGDAYEITLAASETASDTASMKLVFRASVPDGQKDVILCYKGKEVSHAK